MRGFLAVARREIVEKRFVFAAAAVASLVPFAVPILRGLHGRPVGEARAWTAVILASAFSAGLALVLGSSILSAELAHRRISFYFSRPLSGLSIWAGKITGGCLLSFGAAAVVIAPSFVAGGGSLGLTEISRSMVLIFVVGVLSTVVVLHAAAIAVRARSALLALDAILLLAAATLTFLTARGFALLYAAPALRVGLAALGAVFLVALVAAGIASVVHGRTDIRAAHRALSKTLWSIVAIGIIGFAGFFFWVGAAKPSDIHSLVGATPLGGSSWLAVRGWARGALATFLIDSSSGRYQRAVQLWHWPETSGDGKVIAWFEPGGSSKSAELVTLRLTDPAARSFHTRILMTGTPESWFLSPSGTRIAISSHGILSIFDIPTGRSLGSVRIADGGAPLRGSFVGEDKIRSYAFPGQDTGRLEISEFDLATKTFARTGTVDNLHGFLSFIASPSGERVIVRETWGPKLLLIDGRSGALLRTLAAEVAGSQGTAAFLSDGRVVLASPDRTITGLHVYSADGQFQKTITLPLSSPEVISFGGEVARNQLIVGVGWVSLSSINQRIYLVAVNDGSFRKVADGLGPIVYNHEFPLWGSELDAVPPIGSEATKLFLDKGGSLIHFDPLTGHRRIILRGR